MRVTYNLTTLVAILLLGISHNSYASGLLNSGFEDGLTDWTTDSAADVVTVVGSEGPADSTTYADENITVDPYIGQQMLRLSAPKNVNEQQNRGDNSVSQTFTASSTSISFSFRLFSWEHRGDDTFSFGLQDGNGKNDFSVNGASINIGPGSATDCPLTPCSFTIDVGKRGNFLDSDWIVVEISNLTEGLEYTLNYNVTGGGNEAHGTWAYFDNVNNPPVAKFNFTQEGIAEGDLVTFTDESYDPDPGDKVVSWEWTITGDNFDETKIVEEQNPVFVFPDEGNFIVSLTVTDTYGATNTVSTNGVTTDGAEIADLNVLNLPVLLTALNQEVLAGNEYELIGRFVDPGFTDTHTATWDSVGSATAIVQEENIPTIASGIVTGLAYAPETAQTLSGLLTVTDNSGAVNTDDFSVIVLGDDFDTREPNNSLTEAPQLESGWVYLSSIDTLGDVDFFEVTLPGGGELPAGSEVLVKLKNLPADYDLILLSEITDSIATAPWLRTPWLRTPIQSAPWLRTPWLRTPWLRTPWLRTPWLRTPWLRTPWLRTPWLRTPWLRTPWLRTSYSDVTVTFDQFPLSELAYTISEGDGIGGSDIALSEIGLETLDGIDGLSIAGISANRGLEEEEILIRTDYPGTKIYVVVKSNNGSFTPEPYSFQVETSVPFEIDAFLGDACLGNPKVPATSSTSSSQTLFSSNGASSLFVLQKERMQAIYGMDDTTWNNFESKLISLAEHPSVNGKIISLPSNIYDAWDSNPCSVEEANNTSAAIRDEIAIALQANPTIQYVTLLGSDDIVPYRRVPDETSISNERLYAFDSLLRPGSPLFISTYKGYNLTVDYYVDSNPLNWQGRELYLPQISISRLVETPAEIAAAADKFIFNNGIINAATALVTGYDFFEDGAQESADNLSSNFETETLINSDWSSDDIRCKLFGDSSKGTGCNKHDINAFNAHFNHFGALSAYGFTAELFGDIVTSAEVANADVTGLGLTNTINTSLGCHAGLNVPDGSALTGVFGDGIDPNLDFAQAMAQQNALFVASTGYGLGDDTAVAGTERLMALFSEELSLGGPIGQALTTAKRTYIKTVNSFTVYDEKSLIQTTLYGLPMYQVAPSAAIISNSSATAGTQVGTFNLNVDDGGVVTTSHTLEEVITDSGIYVNASGDHQATAWRPVQPRVVKDIVTGQPVHGLLITSGNYVQESPVNPVISIMKQEWQQDSGEEDICLNAFWPSFLASVNSLETATGYEQSLVVIPGQFRCTSGAGSAVSGIQRLYTDLDIQLLRSSSSDFNSPTINEVDFRDNGDGTKTITVDATDINGISKIVMLVDYNGTIYSVSSGAITSAGPYSIVVPNFLEGSSVIIQVVDGAGNVAKWTGKGADIHNIIVESEKQKVFSNLVATQLTATIIGFNDLLDESNSVFYRWNFGDNQYDFGRLAKSGTVNPVVTIDNQGNATFTVQHQYSIDNDVTATIKITDAFGGIGSDDVQMQFCGDPAEFTNNPNLDLTACAIDNTDSTNVSILMSVAGMIADDMQFRLFIDYKGTGKNSGPDGKADELLKYHAGVVTGLKSLVVTPLDVDGNGLDETLKFDFDLSETRFKGNSFQWYVETQDGVAGQAGIGHADFMPDNGFYNYTLH